MRIVEPHLCLRPGIFDAVNQEVWQTIRETRIQVLSPLLSSFTAQPRMHVDIG